MNITKKVCVKFGQTDDVEKKYCKFDEVIALMEQAVKEPESSGNYHDYVELCKLYDKNENGTMMLAELDTFLCLLGEKFKSVFTLSPSLHQVLPCFVHDLEKQVWNSCLLNIYSHVELVSLMGGSYSIMFLVISLMNTRYASIL